MSSKSNVSSQAISLPKGGGAVKGIGETFQPNLFSGTGNYSIPVAISPGRSGFGPGRDDLDVSSLRRTWRPDARSVY
jgi:hypothetical protein